jgi:hypothetical protein
MKNELIINEIRQQNLHWKNEDTYFFTENKYKRKLFFELLKYLDEKEMISVIGLRRTGKTVLLKQLAEYLVKNKKINPYDIFFLSFDEAIPCEPDELAEYFDYYLDTIRTDRNKTAYIFIDEIQYIDKWQHILKRYYDTRPNIKFIVSGSSSIFLRKRTTESLAGRIFEFKLDVLDFQEYLELVDKNKGFIDEYNKVKIDIKNISIENIKKNENKIRFFLAGENRNILQKYFEDYLSFGHFPRVAMAEDEVIARRYLREAIYRKTIESDIPRIYKVEKVNKLRFLYEIFIRETGNEISLKNLAEESNLDYRTLDTYLEYFEESLLLNVVYNFSKSFRKSMKSLKKVYIASTNFLEIPKELTPQIKGQVIGHLAETYVFNLLKKQFEFISIFNQKGKEIDFVATNHLLNTDFYYFVEVKYKSNLRQENFKFLQGIVKKRKTKIPYLVLSKNDFDFSDEGVILPLCLMM